MRKILSILGFLVLFSACSMTEKIDNTSSSSSPLLSSLSSSSSSINYNPEDPAANITNIDGVYWSYSGCPSEYITKFNDYLYAYKYVKYSVTSNDYIVYKSFDGTNFITVASNATYFGNTPVFESLGKLWYIGYWTDWMFGSTIAYSDDGITFTQVPLPTFLSNNGYLKYYLTAFTSNKMFIIGGGNNSGWQNSVYSSSDGIYWSQQSTIPIRPNIALVAWDKIYLFFDNTNRVYKAGFEDNLWDWNTVPFTNVSAAYFWKNKIWVYQVENDKTSIFFSADGYSWAQITNQTFTSHYTSGTLTNYFGYPVPATYTVFDNIRIKGYGFEFNDVLYSSQGVTTGLFNRPMKLIK